MLDEDMKYRRGSRYIEEYMAESGGVLPTTPTTSCSTDAARLYNGCALQRRGEEIGIINELK